MMVCSTGAGSARPVVSTITRRNETRPLSRSRVSFSSAVDEIAPYGAAQAAARQHDHAVVDLLDQKMIEADLAELVDQHGGVGERRIAQQRVEERGLAGAEEAGQHRQRHWRRRAALRGAAVRHWFASGQGCGLAAEGTAAVVAGFFLTGAGFGLVAVAAAGFFVSGFSIVAVLAAGFGLTAAFGFACFFGLRRLGRLLFCRCRLLRRSDLDHRSLPAFFFFLAIFTGASGAPSGRVLMPRTGMTETGIGAIDGGRSSSKAPGVVRKFGIMAA